MYQRHPALERPAGNLFHDFMTVRLNRISGHFCQLSGSQMNLPMDFRKSSFWLLSTTGIKPA
jgi:hypothetical protein